MNPVRRSSLIVIFLINTLFVGSIYAHSPAEEMAEIVAMRLVEHLGRTAGHRLQGSSTTLLIMTEGRAFWRFLTALSRGFVRAKTLSR